MFFKSTKVIGLDIGSSYIKIAEVDSSRKGATLVSFGIAPTPSGAINGRGEVVETSALAATFQNLIKEVRTKRKHVSVGVWGPGVMVKKITGPKLPMKDLQANLRFEAEQYIPFDINEVNLDCAILNRTPSPETMDYLIVAAQRKVLFQLAEIIETSGLQCTVVDVTGFSLANTYHVNYGDKPGQVTAIVNCGSLFTNVVVVDGPDVIMCRDVASGGANITAEISRSMNVSFEEAEALKLSYSSGQSSAKEVQGIVTAAQEELISEINKSFEFLNNSSGDVSIQRVMVTGGSSQLPGFLEGIRSVTSIPVERFAPFATVAYNSKQMSEQYIQQISPYIAPVLGLALRSAEDK